jgi:hypothetical protein
MAAMSSSDAPTGLPDPGCATRCVLAHPLFATLGAVSFRRAESDGTPVMVIPMGDREASVPLRALQREFNIDDECEDGRMLARIAESLDFVAGLHIGDPLPAEVLTGRASWEPGPRHRQIAANRLKMQLLEWLEPGALAAEGGDQATAMARLDDDPQVRVQVQAAFDRAAQELGLATREEAVALVERLAEEIAYIEALREGLLARVRGMLARLERHMRGWRGDAKRLESITQVQRLTTIGHKQISSRFEEVDGQTGEVLAALRNLDSQQAFIRSNRDYLYRCQRAWEPILARWDTAPPKLDEKTWAIIAESYHFLAQRYMPVNEWQAFNSLRSTRPQKKLDTAMTW